MKYPRIVYAIYLKNESGNTSCVYVGTTVNEKERLIAHKCGYFEWERQMNVYGYDYQVLDVINNHSENYREYDWIDFFERTTNLTILNKLRKRSENFYRLIQRLDFGTYIEYDARDSCVKFMTT